MTVPPRPSTPSGTAPAVPASATHPYISTIAHNGRRYAVTCRIAFDGIEHVGRLWFAEEDSGDAGQPDRGAIPGSTRDEVIALARRLNEHDLIRRCRRALAEKRRYLQLRRVADDIITKIRYMNQIALSVKTGLLDAEDAKQEMELTEKQLHECVTRLRDAAGQEG
jgi:hypothetical protein